MEKQGKLINGFTLTETLVSLAIFGILMLLVGKLIVSFLLPGIYFRETALIHAKSEMETVMLSTPGNDTTYTLLNPKLKLERNITIEDSIYFCKINVLYLPDSTKLIELKYYDYWKE